MKNMKHLVTASAALMAFGAHAAEKGFTGHGSARGAFTFGLGGAQENTMEFGATQVYLGAEYGFGEGWSAHITYDALAGGVHTAYKNWDGVLGGSMKIGLSDDSYILNAEAATKTDWAVDTIAETTWGVDRNYGLTYTNSSDMLDIAVDITNGLGDVVANDKSLLFGADLAIKPNDMIKILGSISFQMEDTDNAVADALGYAAGIAVNHEMIDLLGEVASVQVADFDATMGFGATAHMKFGNLGLLAQFATGNDGYKAVHGTDITIGLTNKFTDGVNSGVLFTNSSPEVGDADSAIKAILSADF